LPIHPPLGNFQLGASPNEGGPVSIPGTPSGEDGPTPISRDSPRASPGHITPDPGQAEELVAVVSPPSPETDWQKPITDYLQLGIIPDNETETRRLTRRAKGYLIPDNELYQRNASGILQWCIPLKECKALLHDIHEGICEHHASSRSMVGKAFRQGFYWPTAASDATQIVRSCKGCQFFSRQVHAPTQELQTIPITWSFAVWGLDLLGPFKKAPGGLTHLLVTVYKFTKWVEAKPLAKISSKQAVDFIQDIIFCFGVPNSINTNNDTQFTEEKFLDFCDNNNIRVDWAAVAHPRTNGQVESELIV
jgi:hypothetical protein